MSKMMPARPSCRWPAWQKLQAQLRFADAAGADHDGQRAGESGRRPSSSSKPSTPVDCRGASPIAAVGLDSAMDAIKK